MGLARTTRKKRTAFRASPTHERFSFAMLPATVKQPFLRNALLLLLGLLLAAPPALAQDTGTIAGVVVDGETGEPLPGANAVIQGTQTGSQTDLDGRFEITGLDPGTYDLRVSFVGFQPKTVTGIELSAGETERVELSIAPEAAELDEVVVTAAAARDSEAGLLKERQRASAVSDAISAEAISRSGSSTAADAMEKVTGASITDGKYVNMRGLGGRYMNTQLNGAELPSADPDANAVPFDLFPAGLLENIVASKTFTPDQPGSFTGGNINISTRSYPADLSVTVSTSASYNSEVGLGGDQLTFTGGAESIPAAFEGGIPRIGEAQGNEAAAQRLDAASRAFTSPMAPVIESAPIDMSYGLSFGNEFELGGRPLGVVGSLSYDRNVSGYDGGQTGRYALTGDVSTVDQLVTELDLEDQSGSTETLIGGLANISFRPFQRHEVGLNLIYNRSDEEAARYLAGRNPPNTGTDVFETRVLRQTERTMRSVQGQGNHVFGPGRGIRVEWSATAARSEQDEPDFRFFTNHFDPSGTDTSFFITPSAYPRPTRYFRNLEEMSESGNLSVAVPLPFLANAATVKVGGLYQQKDRAFRERRFRYDQDRATYDGNADSFFGRQLGLVGQDDNGLFRFGNYINDVSAKGNNYDGEQVVAAGFAMLDTPLLSGLRFIGGVRHEYTDMTAISQDETEPEGRLENYDWLPSANLVYSPTETMNFRAAYGRTLARPTFRELAPYASFDFVGGYVFVGNAELERSITNNFDLRWEWFLSPGELLAVSAFYKAFSNPIERAINPVAANTEIQFRNVESADVAGLEFEARKGLGFLAGFLERVEVGANLTLTQSQVSIAEDELALIRAYDPDASDTRDLQGQSPYVVNADITYEHPEQGTNVGLYYNRFGERLFAVSSGGAPDLFEQPRNTFDVIVSQQLMYGVRAKVSAKNLLDARYEVTQAFKGQAYVYQAYDQGRSFSIGLTYNL